MFCRFFLLRDRAQNISRARDVREINLGFEFVFRVCRWTRRLRGCRTGFAGRTQGFADQFRLVFFQ
jgi:hypothetical protein